VVVGVTELEVASVVESNAVPPVEAVYHNIFLPAPILPLKLVDSPLHIGLLLAPTLVGVTSTT
jgi:hypothetical protein